MNHIFFHKPYFQYGNLELPVFGKQLFILNRVNVTLLYIARNVKMVNQKFYMILVKYKAIYFNVTPWVFFFFASSHAYKQKIIGINCNCIIKNRLL